MRRKIIEQENTYYLDKLGDYEVEVDTARLLIEQVSTAVQNRELARFNIELKGSQVPVLAFHLEQETAPPAKSGGPSPDVYAIYCVPEQDPDLRLRCDLHLGNRLMYIFQVLTEEEYAARQDASH